MFVSMAVFLVLLRISILNFWPDLQPDSVYLGALFYLWLGWLAIERIKFAEKSQREMPFTAGFKKFRPDIEKTSSRKAGRVDNTNYSKEIV
jgi:hypothetical protein